MFAILSILLPALANAQSGLTNRTRIGGSPLAKKYINQAAASLPGQYSPYIDLDSTRAFSRLMNGNIDVIVSERPLNDNDYSSRRCGGLPGEDCCTNVLPGPSPDGVLMGYDTIVFYTSKNNPVSPNGDITSEKLQTIVDRYFGPDGNISENAATWGEIFDPSLSRNSIVRDMPILLVMGDDTLRDTVEMLTGVNFTDAEGNSIPSSGGTGTQRVKVTRNMNALGILPAAFIVNDLTRFGKEVVLSYNGTAFDEPGYPLQRGLYMYTLVEPPAEQTRFCVGPIEDVCSDAQALMSYANSADTAPTFDEHSIFPVADEDLLSEQAQNISDMCTEN